MKTSFISLAILLFGITTSSQAATLLTYDRLQAGSNNSFGSNNSITGMLAVGQNNIVSQLGTVAMGQANTVSGRNALAVGTSNSLSSYGNSNSLAVGHGNSLEGEASFAIGQNNTISSDWDFGGGYCSLISGYFNYSHGSYSIISGSNNHIPFVYAYQGSEPYAPLSVALFGSGLIGRHDNCTVVGKNNISPEPTVPPSTPSPLFVVGNGSSASSRSNAFEVRDNGDIVISKPQGDISMGIYGN